MVLEVCLVMGLMVLILLPIGHQNLAVLPAFQQMSIGQTQIKMFLDLAQET
jgi:hypothetical protein